MTGWDAEQLSNARLIMAVGLQMNMSSRDIMTALVAAMQESSLRNLSYGDRDSLGLFQQRPSQGWGSRSQVLNPIYATEKFFSSLKGVKDRGNLTMGQAAQAVQRSAYPTAYDKWENDARRLMNASGQSGGTPFPVQRPANNLNVMGGALDPLNGAESGAAASTGSTPGLASTTSDTASPAASGAGATTEAVNTPSGQNPQIEPTDQAKTLDEMMNKLSGNGTGQRSTVVNAAMRWLGTPYQWAGGDAKGPTYGSTAHGSHNLGFDCSGLVLYALAQAGIKGVPHLAASQLTMGTSVGTDESRLQPGDLIGMENGGHIGIYIGNGQYIEAPHTGANVRISELSKRGSGWWGVHLNLSGSYGGANASTADVSGLLSSVGGSDNTVNSYPGLV